VVDLEVAEVPQLVDVSHEVQRELFGADVVLLSNLQLQPRLFFIEIGGEASDHIDVLRVCEVNTRRLPNVHSFSFALGER
jgi:hypothetical protein